MKCRVEGLDELEKKLSKLIGNTDNLVREALFEGGEVLKSNTKAAVRKAANRGYSTGSLESSIVCNEPTKNAYGYFVAVHPVGTDSKGVREGEKWGYLLNGNGKGSEKRDFKTEAIEASEKKCAEIAQRIFDDYVDSL